MKRFLVLTTLLSFSFLGSVDSKEIQAFCLITTDDLKRAKLDSKEEVRFAGKTIKLLLNFAKDDKEKNLIFDLSNNSDIGLITGLKGGTKFMQIFEIKSRGIEYKSSMEAKGFKGVVEYKYKNFLLLKDDMAKTLFVNATEEKGFNTIFNFQINCQDKEYSKEEILNAKKTPLSDKERKKKIDNFSKEMKNKNKKFDSKEVKENYKKRIEQEKLNKKSDSQIKTELSELLIKMKKGLFDPEYMIPDDCKFVDKETRKTIPICKKDRKITVKRYWKGFKKGQQLNYSDIENLDAIAFFSIPLTDNNHQKLLTNFKQKYIKEKNKK